ncbi:hypothetical protein ACFP81_01025 [Deinococcus lacus]|uniref:PEP-utilising enzyme mobile domain-containing protein n=1 Tax=Deinococcus lacus TaxID=392561 RepID=A0ABW1YBD2_9DEIO
MQAALAQARLAQVLAGREVSRLVGAAAPLLGLERSAAPYLTLDEWVAGLDGTLDTPALRALAQVRAAASHVGADAWAEAGAEDGPVSQLGRPLAAGVRQGQIHRVRPGEPVPEGAVALLPHPVPEHLPTLLPASALVLAHGTAHARVSAQAREHGQSAVSVSGVMPWLGEGDLVRVNGATGQVTLLRRAEPAAGQSGWPQPEAGRRSTDPYALDLG